MAREVSDEYLLAIYHDETVAPTPGDDNWPEVIAAYGAVHGSARRGRQARRQRSAAGHLDRDDAADPRPMNVR